MLSSLQKRMMRAGLALLVSSIGFPSASWAAPIEDIAVHVETTQGSMPDAVKERIQASISAIGQRILVGKEENLFRLNESQYDKVLADIMNRVIVGYVVSDIHVSYGPHTSLSVQLLPVGHMIQEVETEVDYGNLSPEARAYVQEDMRDISSVMSHLLIGLPVDSVGWAESVTESAGRDVLHQLLPEFQANFEVISGEKTKVRISLIPQGQIVRTGKLTFHKTTVPRLFMLRAVTETEGKMKHLEGLPVAFVSRHRDDIATAMNEILKQDSFIQKYGIETEVQLFPGEITELKVDALTDHWIIKTEAWMDAGRDGNKNTAIEGMLGHFIGQSNVVFGEARFYPGPVKWNVYGGWYHHFGHVLDLGYKYDFVENSNHVFGTIPFGEKIALRYDRDFREKENEFGLSYKIHNYMTLEYVYNDEEGKWLRLIANL